MSEPNLTVVNTMPPIMNPGSMIPINNGTSNNGNILSNRPGPGPAPPPSLLGMPTIQPQGIVKGPRHLGGNTSAESSSSQSQLNVSKTTPSSKNAPRTARTGQTKTNIKTDRR